MQNNISDDSVTISESHRTIFMCAFYLQNLEGGASTLDANFLMIALSDSLSTWVGTLTIECSHILSHSARFSYVSLATDLDAMCTSLAIPPISRDKSIALAELPIKITT
jgi:hypothetical protein